MRLKCVQCGWMGSFVEPRTAVRLTESSAPCPNCNQPLVVHFNSDEEQWRFEDIFSHAALGKPAKQESLAVLAQSPVATVVPKDQPSNPVEPAPPAAGVEVNAKETVTEQVELQSEHPNAEAVADSVLVQQEESAETALEESHPGLTVLDDMVKDRLDAIEDLSLRFGKLESAISTLEEAYGQLIKTATWAQLHGERKTAVCVNQEDGFCLRWAWPEKPEIGLRVAQGPHGRWFAKPTPAFCAPCPAFQEKRAPSSMIPGAERQLHPGSNPAAGLLEATQSAAGSQ